MFGILIVQLSFNCDNRIFQSLFACLKVCEHVDTCFINYTVEATTSHFLLASIFLLKALLVGVYKYCCISLTELYQPQYLITAPYESAPKYQGVFERA